MQNYTTIIGVIELRAQKCSYDTVQQRYSIGSGTVALIMNRYKALGLSLDDLKQMEPSRVEAAFYPKENIQRKDTPIVFCKTFLEKNAELFGEFCISKLEKIAEVPVGHFLPTGYQCRHS